eukprot:CAMPEP_0197719666 /NCGR_PEP_ID=MMETSP1434-20131217/3330_1 /TAXON_ID=265543 /ORGANISM="Minutocellus polymorphus, Strain CCMP3303" /LENGTH=401 /DNA_ID=CAMNT_0043304433 /DNA_START=147 /DNA_END=1348 /DNA_ORIENTATION=+
MNSAEQEPLPQETSVPTLTPTAYPTVPWTIEPTNYNSYNNPSVSCKNFVLGDGATTTIDSETTCEQACMERNSYQYYWPSWDHEHFQYTSFERVYDGDGIVNEGLVDAVGECVCDYSSQARSQTLCGPTEYRLQLPEKPLPQCSAIGVEYNSACSRQCSSVYPTDSPMQYDWSSDWSFSQGRYRESCTCILSDVITVEICDGFGPKSNPNGSYNYNDEGRSIFPYLVILAVLGIGGCICVVKKSPNEQDQALSQYRRQQQQQQRRQEASVSGNAGQPTEEELVARGDVVRSNLFSHSLSEDDDLKNLTSILSTASSNETNNGEENENEPASAPSSGGGAGFLETLRSSISTNRTSVRSANKAECSICLSGYETGETVSWAKEEGCDHMYHEQCIVGWLSTA